MRYIPAVLVLGALASPAAAFQSFTNWETPHVHPLDVTPDRSRLLAVNTADNRLEVFDITGGAPVHVGSAPVGLDPVTVRARNNTEAWVVNHVSDSVSLVDLTTLHVVGSIRTDDEPADLVFAGTPQRAFISCSQANSILVIDPLAPDSPATRINIVGEDPRALAVNAAGTQVYVAVFESGNRSTILGGGSNINLGFPPNAVNTTASPYFDPQQPFQLGVNPPNPPPNDGAAFHPPMSPGLPTPPRVGMIVRKNAAGQWMDDNNHDWTALVSGASASQSGRPAGWDLYDHDVAVIDAASLNVTYATGCMNLCMALAVNPAGGQVTVVGTDGINEVRFEPVLAGRFLRVNMTRVDPAVPATLTVNDLNPHLLPHYDTSIIPFQPIPQAERDKSLGDPRGIVWNAAGTRGYVTGMGSNNVGVFDALGNRVPLAGDPQSVAIDVGEGPTGIVLDEPRSRIYVLNKFAASISTLDLASESEILPRTPLFDPSPAAIKIGRKHLYDTHRNSGLGHIACASCHVDARMDRLAWDLGDPSGGVKIFNNFANNGTCPSGDCQNCNFDGCQNWHPMKGPMVTQTLQDIIGKEPHHWRGDRDGLEEFAGAFRGLQGDDAPLPANDMQEFENFLATIHFPPNPHRNFNNSLPSSLPLPGHFTTGRFGPAGQPLPNGNAAAALTQYRTAQLDGVQCVTCHSLPTGAGPDARVSIGQVIPLPPGPNGERHLSVFAGDGSTNVTMKISQLRNLYEKVGFELTQPTNTAGFGYLHDGSVDSIARFLNEPVFAFTSDQMTADFVALMLAFSGSGFGAAPLPPPFEIAGVPSQDTHAAVGRQTTLVSAASPLPGQLQLIADMITQANANAVGLIVKGRQNGLARGWRYSGANVFQSDRVAETITAVNLQASAAPGSELTYTVVVKGSETRIGIDRDLDGFLDRDELDQCSDPADASSVPGSPSVDIDQDGDEDAADVSAFVAALLDAPQHPSHVSRSDLNCDASADGRDVSPFVAAYLGG